MTQYRPGWEAYAWTKAGRWFRRKRRPTTLLHLPEHTRLWPDMTEAEELQLIACLALVVRGD